MPKMRRMTFDRGGCNRTAMIVAENRVMPLSFEPAKPTSIAHVQPVENVQPLESLVQSHIFVG